MTGREEERRSAGTRGTMRSVPYTRRTLPLPLQIELRQRPPTFAGLPGLLGWHWVPCSGSSASFLLSPSSSLYHSLPSLLGAAGLPARLVDRKVIGGSALGQAGTCLGIISERMMSVN